MWLEAGVGEHPCDRLPVARGVLADVQTCEVKPEHLDLADHVVQVARGDPLRALCVQRALSQTQVGEQFAGIGVALRLPPAARAKALAREREELPVWLVGVASSQLTRKLREALGAGLQRRLERRRRPCYAAGHRHPFGQSLHALLKECQRHPSHQVKRLPRHPRRHVGVAVTVTADPRAKRKKRRHHNPGTGKHPLNAVFEISVQPRDDVEQRRLEIDQPGPHLVEDSRRDGADLIRAPQFLDRGRELGASSGESLGSELALVELPDRGEHPRQLGHGRVASCLGRMRGQHETDLRLREQLLQTCCASAAIGDDPDRLAQRPATRRRERLTLVGADAANALVVLGEIDEAKIGREGAHQHGRLLERQALHQRAQLLAGRLLTRSQSLPQGAGALLERERLGLFLGTDHLAEQAAQQFDVVVQRARQCHRPALPITWMRRCNPDSDAARCTCATPGLCVEAVQDLVVASVDNRPLDRHVGVSSPAGWRERDRGSRSA